MVRRTIQEQLERLAALHPVVTITGPRQSGKTTLARSVFPDHAYVSLETPSERALSSEDPLAFLARFDGRGAILDEIQRAPELPSYLQSLVDDDPTPGRFILTGSQSLSLLDRVSQSLAGRTALLELLPLDLAEIRRFPSPPEDLDTVLWEGGYPRIHDRELPPSEWLADYTATYLERDVAACSASATWPRFIRSCAFARGHRAATQPGLARGGLRRRATHRRSWRRCWKRASSSFACHPSTLISASA